MIDDLEFFFPFTWGSESQELLNDPVLWGLVRIGNDVIGMRSSSNERLTGDSSYLTDGKGDPAKDLSSSSSNRPFFSPL